MEFHGGLATISEICSSLAMGFDGGMKQRLMNFELSIEFDGAENHQIFKSFDLGI